MNSPPDPEDEKKSHLGGWLVAMAVCLLLYVLSIGPVVALIEKRRIMPGKTLDWFYRPVDLLYDQTILREPIKRYVELWRH